MSAITHKSNIHAAEGTCILFLIVTLAGSMAIVPGVLAAILLFFTEEHRVLTATLSELQAQFLKQQTEFRKAEAERALQYQQLDAKNRELFQKNQKLQHEVATLAEEVRELELVGASAVQKLEYANTEIVTLSSNVDRLARRNEEFLAANADLTIRNDHLSKKADDLATRVEESEGTRGAVTKDSQTTQPKPRERMSGSYRRLSGHFTVQHTSVPTRPELVIPDIIPTHKFPDNMADVDPRCIDPLVPEFTCIGVTRQDKRCGQRMISNKSKDWAANTIREMRSPNPGDTLEEASLRKLSNAMLCPLWHKSGKHDNTERITRSWLSLLEDVRAAHTEQKRPAPVTPTRSRPVQNLTHSASSSFSLSPRSVASSQGISPSTAATTPEREDGRMYQFGVDDRPLPFHFLLSRSSKDGSDDRELCSER